MPLVQFAKVPPPLSSIRKQKRRLVMYILQCMGKMVAHSVGNRFALTTSLLRSKWNKTKLVPFAKLRCVRKIGVAPGVRPNSEFKISDTRIFRCHEGKRLFARSQGLPHMDDMIDICKNIVWRRFPPLQTAD